MSTSFLCLPLELRQQIYDLLLVSPTLHVCPHRPHEGPKSTRNGWAGLPGHHSLPKKGSRIQLIPCDPFSSLPVVNADTLTLGVMFTNRQIYDETREMLWDKNTLSFAGTEPAVRVLKEIMGQTASRRVQRITLTCYDSTPVQLRKEFEVVMGILASRTRKGCLKEVNFRLLAATLLPTIAVYGPGYEHLLETLKRGGETRWARGTRRTLLLDRTPDHIKESSPKWYLRSLNLQSFMEVLPDWIVREMALVWGGIVTYHGKVVWEDSKQIGYMPLPLE